MSQSDTIAKALIAQHGYKGAADILVSLVEMIDADLCGLYWNEGDGDEPAEGSDQCMAALEACDNYRTYVCGDLFEKLAA